MNSENRIAKYTLTGVLIFLLSLSALFLVKGWLDGSFATAATLRAYIGSFGIWGPLILTIIQALQVILPVLPGFLGCIVGSVMFGPLGGFLINYFGISAGSLAAFLLARKYGVAFVQKMVSVEKYASFIRWMEKQKNYPFVLFFAILLPLAPDDFLCYFSGLTSMSARKFSWIILLGKPWCILFYSMFVSHFV